MLNVHDYLAIRVAHQHDESKRSIARRLHHSQATVAKAIASPTGLPDKYRRKAPAAYPKLGPFVARIDAILEADESAPPKQRHTAMQVYRRLVSEEGEMAIDTFLTGARADYQREFDERREALETFCQRYGLHLLALSTEDDPVRSLQQALGKRQR